MDLIIISGVSSGLGLALAKKSIEANYATLGLARNDHADLKVAATKSGSNYRFVRVDLSDSQSLRALDKALLECSSNMGRILFIHCAATAAPIGLISNLSADEVSTGMSTNLLAPILLSQRILQLSSKVKTPLRMIYISSGAASRAIAGSNVYCIAKAGLEMLVKGIHTEINYLDNAVECIGLRPGVIDTRMQEQLRSYDEKRLPEVKMYQDFKAKNLLRSPDSVAKSIFDTLIARPVESGKIYGIDELIFSP